MLGKHPGKTMNGIRRDRDIGIHEKHDIAAGVSYPVVSRCSRPGVFRKPENAYVLRHGDRRSIVRGGIIDHNDLGFAGRGAQG
jgi:hypothetical protein